MIQALYNKEKPLGLVVNREFHFVRRNVPKIKHCKHSHYASERRKYIHLPYQSKRNLVVASITFRNDAFILKCYLSM